MAPMKRFPVKTALAFAAFAGLLVAYRRVIDPAKGIAPAIFAEAARLKLTRPGASQGGEVQAKAPLNGIQGAQAGKPADAGKTGLTTPREAISPYLTDDAGALDGFYAGLLSLEAPTQAEAGAPDVVTVLHYGDSPTTADLITGDVRALLQARFGDAGHGFLLPAKPWAWYGHRDTDISDKGWTISTAVGKGREEVYGLGGVSFEGDGDASSRIKLKDPERAPTAAMDLEFLARPNGGTVSVTVDGGAATEIETAGDAARPAWRAVPFPAAGAGAKGRTVDLKVANGKVRLLGETFFTGKRGLLYDSLGLNGASTSVLSNGFNAAAWAAELEHAQPKLVVINYGTNESGFGSYVDKQYEPTLRTTIARIRAALPEVSILVMSPMDRGRRTGMEGIETFDTIPRIVAIQRRVAAELHCAFFDTFDAMGGEGTMERWYNGHPRLVAGDFIHPTPQGASIVAQLFVKDLLLGYDRYLRREGVGISGGASPLPSAGGVSPVVAAPARISLPEAKTDTMKKSPEKVPPAAAPEEPNPPAVEPPEKPAAPEPDSKPAPPKPEPPVPEAPKAPQA